MERILSVNSLLRYDLFIINHYKNIRLNSNWGERIKDPTINNKIHFRFYTYFKGYPFILRNIKQKQIPAKHEIVDIGINDLLHPPFTHSLEKIYKFKNLITPGWKVVPDSPDLSGEFGIDTEIDNVEYSKELMFSLYEPENNSHLPVIQGHYNDIRSFKDYLNWFLDKYPIPEKIALGTMCKSKDRYFVKEVVRFVRRKLPKTWIHAFGLRMYHLPNIYHSINSWDSMSWTFPRVSGKASCKNKIEREEYFIDYLRTISRNTNNNHHVGFANGKFQYSKNIVNLQYFLEY